MKQPDLRVTRSTLIYGRAESYPQSISYPWLKWTSGLLVHILRLYGVEGKPNSVMKTLTVRSSSALHITP